MILKVKKLNDVAYLPNRAHTTDAGLDISSIENVVLQPGMSHKVGTGISVEIPDGNFGLLTSRSSVLARGLMVGPAVIDSGYRGELTMHTTNLSTLTQTVYNGDRLGQLVLIPHLSPDVISVDELTESERGVCGYGSSGR